MISRSWIIVCASLLASAAPSGGLQLISAVDEDVRNEGTGSRKISLQGDYVDLDPALMIARAGYNARSYVVETEDGYLLTIHRIFPNGPGEHHPVLLQHGLVSSAADWLIIGPGKALAYLLADEGYDVWLGNIRGNTYSRAHVNMSTSSAEFWNFSFHEMGYYDVPAMTAFILKETGHSQLSYVGHSMGTTMFWVFCSTRPEMQPRIRQMHALAPVAFMSRMKSPLGKLSPFERELQISLALIGEYEFLRHGALTGYLEEEFLKINHLGAKGAEYVFFYICGSDPEQFNQTLLPVILGHTPAGASTQTVLHYLQEVKSAKFRQYDEGTAAGNKRKYGTPEPPEYDLSQLEVPVFMHYSMNDYLAYPVDVEELYKRLRNGTTTMLQVPVKSFNHLDFMWANEAKKYVYDPLMSALKEASEKAQVLAREQLTKEKMAEHSQNLDKGKEVLIRSYRKHAEPKVNSLIERIKQLHERQVSAEMAQRWGPDVVSHIEKLKTRMATVQQDKATKVLASKEQTAREHLEWYSSALSRVKTYPDLLVVKSVPLVSRMLSTVADKVAEKAGAPAIEKGEEVKAENVDGETSAKKNTQ